MVTNLQLFPNAPTPDSMVGDTGSAIEAAVPNLWTSPTFFHSAVCAHASIVYMYRRAHGEYALKVGKVGDGYPNPVLERILCPQPLIQRLGTEIDHVRCTP